MKKHLKALLFFPWIWSCGQSTISPSLAHAWGANIGWIHARPSATDGAVIGLFTCTGYLWSANTGWISLGTGMPANGWAYANNTVKDWGVNHDGSGNLSGYAYSANLGWINFEQTQGQPRVNLVTGDLSGWVWSANAGWISLNTVQGKVKTLLLDAGADSDNDGLPDAWEYQQVGNLTDLAAGKDFDEDGSPDQMEYLAGTDPADASDRLRILSYVTDGEMNTLSWSSRPGRLYQIQNNKYLEEPEEWTDRLPEPLPPDAKPTRTGKVVTTSSQTFFRVRPLLPLSP